MRPDQLTLSRPQAVCRMMGGVGFEVIDEHGPVAGGGRPPAAPSVHAPVPYDLGELEPVEPGPPSDSSGHQRPRSPHPGRPRPQLDRLLRLPAVLVSASLVVGTVLGGYVVHQHGAGQSRAAARSVVQAVALVENQLANGVNGVRMATLTVRLTNFGPEPLAPVLSPKGHQPTQVSPLVESAAPNPKAAPEGGTALVLMTVPLGCQQVLGDLPLQVRTVDQKVHELTVPAPSSEVLQQDQTMCGGGEPEHTYVSVSLTGSVTNPMLTFTNQASQARRLFLRADSNDLSPLQGVRVALGRSFPMDVDGNGTVRVPLRVHVDRCVRDAAAYESVQIWLAFQETDIGQGAPLAGNWQNMTGTGVGSVITAAMLRACDRR